MTEQQFTDAIDGLVNDFENAMIDGKGLRDGICDTVITLAKDAGKLPHPTINELAKSVFEANSKKGFHDQEREVGTYLMLMVSELGEALEADRKDKRANWAGFNHDLSYWGESEPGYDRKWKQTFELCLKDSHEDEIADTFIRILDYCGAKGIDLQAHVDAKLKYNAMRSHKHGGKAY